jgi:hypothetical protein
MRERCAIEEIIRLIKITLSKSDKVKITLPVKNKRRRKNSPPLAVARCSR